MVLTSEAYFQAGEFKPIWQTLQPASLTICQGIFNPVFISHAEDLESFFRGRRLLTEFEARVSAVQETDAYFARVFSIRMEKGRHGVYHLAQGVKTVLPRESRSCSLH